MRKFIKLERIRANRESIQKKLNKKWLTCGIFTCVAAIAMIGSYRYISGIVKVSSNVNGKELPIYCVQTNEKKVALSFDAAWGNDDTQRILDILKEHNVHVTFFMTGGWVESYPDDVKAIYEAGVQNGQYDIAEDIPVDQYKDLAADKNLTMDVRSGGTLNLFLNTTEGVMADEKVRQAALAALNCDDILMASYGDADLYKLNAGWCNPDDAQWGTEAGSEYYNQNDVEKAKKLLSESSYNNEKIVLVTTPEYNEMYNATLVVQEQLKAAGFNAEVESYDFSTFMEHRADPKQFSMYITSNSYNMLPIQLSVLDKGWAGLDRPEVTDGIKAIRSASSNEEAKAAWEDLQSFIYEYGAASVIGHFTNITAMNSKVENYQYLRFPIYWNITFAE